MKHLILVCLVTISISSHSNADHWPQWRGPEGTGVAVAGEYPAKFSAEENVLWKVELPGRGSSTPVIWDDQIFVTSPIDGKDGVICYNFDGKELWRETFGPERAGKHLNGTGSNPSPVTDGKNVVVYYKSGTVACLTVDGKVLWETNLQERYGKDTLWWDLGTSPILAAGSAVIAVMQAGDSYLVALDLESGDVAWKQERMFPCKKESDQSYTTPRLVKLDGKDVIVTWGADHLTGHDAVTGESLWECGGFNPDDEAMWRVIASPAVDGEVAVVPYGRGDFLAAVSLQGAQGDITDSHRLWERVRIGTDVPTPVLHGDTVLLLTDKGNVCGLSKLSGEDLWSDKFPSARAKYYASPTLAGDQLFCAREDGVVMSCRLDNGLHDVQENDMGESVIATPIAIQNKLLIRGEKHLFLVGE